MVCVRGDGRLRVETLLILSSSLFLKPDNGYGERGGNNMVAQLTMLIRPYS